MSPETSNLENKFIEVLSSIGLNLERFHYFDIHNGEKVRVIDPALDNGVGGFREGETFVAMPEPLARLLPGSVVSVQEFLTALGEQGVLRPFIKVFKSGQIGIETNPVYQFIDHDFRLTILHGQMNSEVLALSQLAAKPEPERNDMDRGNYQDHLYRLLNPIIKTDSDYDLTIRDDCLASGDSILGTIAALVHQGKIEILGKTVRVDVAVATHQGILVLRQFAQQNGFKLDLYVGTTAEGLSLGVSSAKWRNIRLHENYILYSLSQRRSLRNGGLKLLFVVGDMGDFLRSLPQTFDSDFGWNNLRSNDHHGPRGLTQIIENDWGMKKLKIYLANGGFGIKVAYPEDEPEIILSAKRIHAVDEGFGVMVDWINTIQQNP